jgi:hypothetical protein
MGTFVNYFNSNINEVIKSNSSQEQHSRFLAFITSDVNSKNLEFVRKNGDYIIFQFNDNTQHQYVFKDNIIYYLKVEQDTTNETTKKITLCTNVSKADFYYDTTNKSLSYDFVINNEEFSNKLIV